MRHMEGDRPFLKAIRKFKDLIGHVHLKDALIEKGDPKCVPIGEGEVPFVDQLQALQNDGFTGLFTIETHYIPEGGTAMDGTNMTLQGLNNILKDKVKGE